MPSAILASHAQHTAIVAVEGGGDGRLAPAGAPIHPNTPSASVTTTKPAPTRLRTVAITASSILTFGPQASMNAASRPNRVTSNNAPARPAGDAPSSGEEHTRREVAGGRGRPLMFPVYVGALEAERASE